MTKQSLKSNWVIYLLFILMIGIMMFIFYNSRMESEDSPTHVDTISNIDDVRQEMIIQSAENRKIARQNSSTIVLIFLTTIGTVSAIIFNPKLLELKNDLGSFKYDVSNNFTKLSNEVKVFTVHQEIEKRLQSIISDALLTTTDSSLKHFILDEGSNLVSYAKAIMDTSMDFTVIELSNEMINRHLRASQKRSFVFNRQFRVLFCERQKVNLNLLRDEINDIVNDSMFNSKHERFAIACYKYLRNHLGSVCAIYNETKYHNDDAA